MKVDGKGRLDAFAKRHADVRGAIETWLAEAEDAEWRTPQDIIARYRDASFVENQVVFNLKGNRYRLVVKISYKNQTVLVTRIGTHAEYDKWQL